MSEKTDIDKELEQCSTEEIEEENEQENEQ